METERSSDEIRRELDEKRAELERTVRALEEKLSPARLAREARGSVADGLRSVGGLVRRHPLSATLAAGALVGAAAGATWRHPWTAARARRGSGAIPDGVEAWIRRGVDGDTADAVRDLGSHLRDAVASGGRGARGLARSQPMPFAGTALVLGLACGAVLARARVGVGAPAR